MNKENKNEYYGAKYNALTNSKRTLWKKNPEEYVRTYMYEGEKFTSKAMAFGTQMHNAIETGESTGDIEVDLLITDLPKFPDGQDLREIELHATIKVGNEETPILAKLDRLKSDFTAFKDWKTGKNAWTQAKVDKDEQITFYCMIIFIQKKIIPNDIELVWIPTEEDEFGKLKITGEFVRFHTHRKMSDILNMMVDCRKVWKQINERYEQELLK